MTLLLTTVRTLFEECTDLVAKRRPSNPVCPPVVDRRTGHAPPSPTGTLAVGPRTLLQRAGFGRILGVGAVGAALAGIFANPVRADEALDVQMQETSSSLEVLAVATYGAALTLPFIIDGNPLSRRSPK